MDCIDFSTNQIMRPFGAVKPVVMNRYEAINRPFYAAMKPKPKPPVGGVKLATGYPADKRTFVVPIVGKINPKTGMYMNF